MLDMSKKLPKSLSETLYQAILDCNTPCVVGILRSKQPPSWNELRAKGNVLRESLVSSNILQAFLKHYGNNISPEDKVFAFKCACEKGYQFAIAILLEHGNEAIAAMPAAEKEAAFKSVINYGITNCIELFLKSPAFSEIITGIDGNNSIFNWALEEASRLSCYYTVPGIMNMLAETPAIAQLITPRQHQVIDKINVRAASYENVVQTYTPMAASSSTSSARNDDMPNKPTRGKQPRRNRFPNQ